MIKEQVFSENLQNKIVSKISMLNKKFVSEKKEALKKNFNNPENSKTIIAFNKNPEDHNFHEIKIKNKVSILKNILNKVFNSDRKYTNSIFLHEFQSCKKIPSVFVEEKLNQNEKNCENNFLDKVLQTKEKEEKKLLSNTMDQTDFLESDKENFRINENSINYEPSFLERVYLEKRATKFMVKDIYDTNINRTKEENILFKKRKDFIENVTLYDLKRKEKERMRSYAAKKKNKY